MDSAAGDVVAAAAVVFGDVLVDVVVVETLLVVTELVDLMSEELDLVVDTVADEVEDC